MKRQIGITALLMILLMVSGCSEIAEQIEDSTEKTFTVSEIISDETSQRQTQLERISGQGFVNSGQTKTLGSVTLSTIGESADAARLGLADVQFSLRSRLTNQSGQATTVGFGLGVEDATVDPVILGTVTLGAGATLELTQLADMDQEPEAIRLNFLEAFALMDEDLVIVPVLDIQGGANGVSIDYIDIAAEPAALTSQGYDESIDSGSIDAHVYDTKLLGTVSNNGQNNATVIVSATIATSEGYIVIPIAETLLAPGQSIEGMDMLVDGGAGSIKTAVKHGIKGDVVAYHFLALGSPDFSVQCNQLRFEAKITVKADIF